LVYFSLGNAFFTYNIAEARAKELEIRREESCGGTGKEEKKDDKKEQKEETEEEKAKKEREQKYRPNEVRVKVTVQKDYPCWKDYFFRMRVSSR
jgi:hypothetical protein